MAITEVLVGIAALLWIIPSIYVLQSGSVRTIVEALVMLALCLSLPYLVQFVEVTQYGVAAKITLNDALLIGVLQLALWLGGMMVAQLANRCRIPPRVVAKFRENER